MKIDRNIEFINNPTLYYKLDPGEPGLATPTSASRSIAKVALHEAGNIRRFQREAAEKGGYVVYSFLGLNLQYKGSFLAATSGRSEALIIYPANKENNKNKVIPLLIDDKEKELNVKNGKGDKKNNEKINDKDKKEKTDVIKNNKSDKIEKEIDELKNKKINLETKFGQVNFKFEENKKDPAVESQIKEIDRKINYLEIQKQMEKQKEFLMNISRMQNFTLKLIGMNFTSLTELSNTGNLIDTIV